LFLPILHFFFDEVIDQINSHRSPKNPAAAMRPGARGDAGALTSITAQSGSFGVWRALLE